MTNKDIGKANVENKENEIDIADLEKVSGVYQIKLEDRVRCDSRCYCGSACVLLVLYDNWHLCINYMGKMEKLGRKIF